MTAYDNWKTTDPNEYKDFERRTEYYIGLSESMSQEEMLLDLEMYGKLEEVEQNPKYEVWEYWVNLMMGLEE